MTEPAEVSFSTYELYRSKAPGEIAPPPPRQGAWLRVRFSDDSVGYGDLCPVTVFKDLPLIKQLDLLEQGQATALSACALACAKADADARSRSAKLHSDQQIENHYLVPDIVNFPMERISILEQRGYRYFKVKMGSELERESRALRQLCEGLSSGSKIRLDFNLKTDQESFFRWLDQVADWLTPGLDFIEDPFTYVPAEWQRVSKEYGVRLALDYLEPQYDLTAAGAAVLVIKPAMQDLASVDQFLIQPDRSIIVTHYLESALGQSYALAIAQQLAAIWGERLEVCGLQMVDYYLDSEFQRQIKNDGPFVLPPDGTGLGFDQILERQRWIKLCEWPK